MMVPTKISSDSSARRLERLQALLQLDSGERRRELERIREEDPRTGAALDDLLAHETSARAEGFLASEPSPDPDPLIGTWVGPYQVERILGRGGMGTVYLAHRREPYRQPVAIKRMHAGLSGRLASRFDAERQILATLIHPGIVRLLDGGSGADGIPYLVMEYVAGSRLDDHCRDHRATPEERVRLVLATADALGYAHRQGTVHRDLKPSNILVDEQGKPRVTDFGLAKLIRAAAPEEATETNLMLGTPPYMAPERLTLGPGRNEPGVDVYSLGVILFTLMADRLPFESSRTLEGCVQAIHEDAPLLRRIKLAIPRDLETITSRALARDPRDRFADAGVMAEQLRLFLAGEPLTIRPPTPVDRLAKWAARRRGALLAWAASFALVLLTMIGILIQWNRSLRRDQAALRTTVKSMWLASTRLFEALPHSDPAVLPYHGDLARSFESSRERGLIRPEPELDRQGAVLIRQYAAALEEGGCPDEALPYIDRSIALLRPLPTRIADPETRAWTEFDLFRSLIVRVSVLRKLRRSDEALAESAEAIDLVRGLTDRFPDDPAWWEARGRQLIYHAQILKRLGRREDASRVILEALEFARRSVNLAGDDADLVKLNTLLQSLSDAADEFPVPEDQERCLRELCALADRIARISDDVTAREAGTSAQDRLGRFLREQGRFAEAVVPLRRALEMIDLRRASPGAGPGLVEYRRQVAMALEACREAAGLIPERQDR
ncbi:serine/threonine-protein kinase [Aquisphaera insulae]|uniref:serine/threonine-protein kinase n=1 Tax=Aquisphaera insulae TaxID=2712864 RepID=UPI0013ED3929|nr:serine/threonine-protein kinase [Aquisphaera insulae]